MSIRPFVVPSLLLVGLPLAILVPTTMWVFKVPRFLFESPLYHRKLEIDLGTMRAVVSDPLPDRDTPDAEYYTQGRRSIYHYDGRKQLPYRVRYNAFETETDGRLRQRSKFQALCVGSYGTIYTQTRYYYHDGRGSKFDVHWYASEAEHEPYQVVVAIPDPPPPLDALSIVRVFRAQIWTEKNGTQTEYTVARAMYDNDGNLQLAGVWSQEGKGAFKSNSTNPEKFGFPKRFPVASYLKDNSWQWKETGVANPENWINLHYDYNRWVRQEHFDEAGTVSRRILTYVVTPEDEMLAPVDRQLPFGVWQP